MESFTIDHDEKPFCINPLARTRWTVKGASIEKVLKNYLLFLETLGEISVGNEWKRDSASSRALGLLVNLEKMTTFWALNFLGFFFQKAEEVAKHLQKEECSLVEAAALINKLRLTIAKAKEEEYMEQLWKKAKEEEERGSLSMPELPRRKLASKKLGGEMVDDGETGWKERSFNEGRLLVDKLLLSLDERFGEGFALAVEAERILLDACEKKEVLFPERIAEFLEVSSSKIQGELVCLPSLFPSGSPPKSVVGLRDALVASTSRFFFSEVEKGIKLLLTLPASSAGAERTFSMLRRLKTWTRSTMGQARLTHLSGVHHYSDRALRLNLQKLAAQFVGDCPVRRGAFGKFI